MGISGFQVSGLIAEFLQNQQKKFLRRWLLQTSYGLNAEADPSLRRLITSCHHSVVGPDEVSSRINITSIVDRQVKTIHARHLRIPEHRTNLIDHQQTKLAGGEKNIRSSNSIERPAGKTQDQVARGECPKKVHSASRNVPQATAS